nr:MAG TPA: hypothetical protein [Inoviridae sp.]
MPFPVFIIFSFFQIFYQKLFCENSFSSYNLCVFM